MTKQEAIRKAYGKYWDKMSDAERQFSLDNDGHFRGDFDIFSDRWFLKNFAKGKDGVHYNRPSSISGIENNNDWIIIGKGDSFPPGDYYFWGIFSDGRCIISYCNSNNLINNAFTHYQIINKPKTPIY